MKAAGIALTGERSQVEQEKSDARERTTVDRNEITALQGDRAKVIVDMTPTVLTNYERIRKSRVGVAVSEAVGGRCTKCQIMMRLQLFQELKTAERIITCESCNRILYYVPVQNVVDMSVPTPNRP